MCLDEALCETFRTSVTKREKDSTALYTDRKSMSSIRTSSIEEVKNAYSTRGGSAYNRSNEDRFFLQRLKTYKNIIDENSAINKNFLDEDK